MENKTKKSYVFDPGKLFLTIMAVYVLLVVAFYFLAGPQLHFRESRGNLTMPPGDASTVELVEGATVEQFFSAPIQRLESISTRWCAYNPVNAGTLTVELARVSDGEVLLKQQFDTSTLTDNQVLTVVSEKPIETVYNVPLVLRMYSDAQPGSAGSPIRCTTAGAEGFALVIDGNPAEGMLCFDARGTDHIWIGLHYWALTAGLGLALALVLLVAWRMSLQGRHSYIVNAFVALGKYRFLIRQLVSRDFKTKYKRSILGVFWSFLNPLLMMLVQYFVFSTLFRSDIPNFAAYLIIGTVMFNFFSESVGMALTSILGNAGLITKVYMPKYIYPLTRVLSSLVNLAISLIPMLIVCLFTGVHFHKSLVLALFFIVCLVIFCLGVGLVLSTSMVFFRDTQFLWNVLCMMWMYATPIFYPETILPDNLKAVLSFNPMYMFIKSVRICILNGISPEPMVYIRCLLVALGALLVGAVIFRKNQDKFVLYL